MDLDLEAEGLLEGCATEAAREARRTLITSLLDAGATLDEVRRAVAESRLALLPSERELTAEPVYTVAEVARRAGVEVDVLLAQHQALGMPRRGADQRVLTEDDLRAAEGVRRFLDSDLPAEGLVEVSRVVGQALENVAAASRELVARSLLRPGDSELELAERYAAATRELVPLMGSLLEHQYRVRLREGIRRAAVEPEALESGELPGAVQVSVGFADLVGFTRLGERLPAADLGRLAGRLAAMAADASEPPVQLVKTVGDAAMLASPDPAALVDTLLGLLESADAAKDDFPQLRAGAAFGPALSRGGDWYGSPVNLASRVTDIARAGSLLVTDDLRASVPNDDYRWSRAPARRLKGFDSRVALHRVRRRDGAGDAGPGAGSS